MNENETQVLEAVNNMNIAFGTDTANEIRRWLRRFSTDNFILENMFHGRRDQNLRGTIVLNSRKSVMHLDLDLPVSKKL